MCVARLLSPNFHSLIGRLRPVNYSEDHTCLDLYDTSPRSVVAEEGVLDAGLNSAFECSDDFLSAGIPQTSYSMDMREIGIFDFSSIN